MLIPSNQAELNLAAIDHKLGLLEGFDWTINWKVLKLAEYIKNAGIDDVIIGVSGGVDSAVVLALLVAARNVHHFNIHAYTINFDVYNKVFQNKFVEIIQKEYREEVLFKTIDATRTLEALKSDTSGMPWNETMAAQSSYALRYQMFFTFAQMYHGITIGTTNKDEFKYSGWFGKNSDMVVDLQVITDWHKCQVVEAAKLLSVPKSIIERAPVGDLLDYSTDEENFGCTYDELAYFTEVLNPEHIDANEFLQKKFEKLRKLHRKNAHKYQGQTFNPVFI